VLIVTFDCEICRSFNDSLVKDEIECENTTGSEFNGDTNLATIVRRSLCIP